MVRSLRPQRREEPGIVDIRYLGKVGKEVGREVRESGADGGKNGEGGVPFLGSFRGRDE